jgi:hypothetical protein
MNLNKYILLLAVVVIPFMGYSQQNETSPYSAFGLGEPQFNGTVEAVGMGGLNATFWNRVQTNPTNPATYSYLGYTNFSVAGYGKQTTLSTNEDSEMNTHSGINQLLIGIPMGKFGGAIGFLSSYSTGYDVINPVEQVYPELALPHLDNPYDGKVQHLYNFVGSGGVNRFFIGGAYNMFKGLSVGVNANYDFGNLNRNVRMYTPPVYHQGSTTSDSLFVVFDGSMYGSAQKQILRLSEWTFDLGVSYTGKFTDKVEFTAGAVYNLGKDVSLKYEDYFYTYKFSDNGVEIPIDTLKNVNQDIDGIANIPTGAKFGFNVGEYSKWMMGVNYEYKDPSNIFHGHNDIIVTQKRSQKMGVGGYFIPRYNSLMSYWERITYRAGFNYHDLGLNINGTDIVDYSIHFGLGLPMKNGLSMVNFAASYGVRGTKDNGLIKEEYFKLIISVSLSDKWFRKVLYN